MKTIILKCLLKTIHILDTIKPPLWVTELTHFTIYTYAFTYFCIFSGTDEKAIIDILAYRTNSQRQDIKKMFKTCFGKVKYEIYLLHIDHIKEDLKI
jgi:hypothetical protein